jgi:2-dehydropantoate 2-reductase
VVLGAGAVGGVIGGRLHQGGADVAFIARGEHGRALQADGLLLRDPDEDVRLPIPTATSPAELDWREGDVLVIATKTQDVAAALDAVLDAAGDRLPVVCATNGLEAERVALRRFAEVHGVCLMLPGTHLEPGVVEAASAPCSGVLDIGLAVGGTNDVDVDLSAALRAGRFVADPHPDVLVRKRCKLLLNLFNVIDAACGADPDIGPLVERTKAEGVAVFTAAGLTWSSDEEDAARRGDHIRMRRIGGKRRGGGSTWQSLARGSGSTEVDFLNGEIALLGRLHGVPTPINAGLQRLARELAADRTPPGSLTVAEVEARLAT